MSTDDDDNTDARGSAATVRVDLGMLPTTPMSGNEPLTGPAAARPEPSVEVGGTLGRYEVVALLGVGGMGIVYRARDPSLDRDLAIKVVRPRIATVEAQTRLLREAQAMAKLRHPNVVPVFDVGTSGDSVFVVMPYLDGGTLGGWLRERPRPWREVLERFLGAGRGLAVAHAAGMIHRDFKPDNVLLDSHGEAQVADFGIARLFFEESLRPSAVSLGSDLTQTGGVVGTPVYMPPEQLRGEPVDARADVFSFCVALYEGLYGERPFAIGDAQAPDAQGAPGAIVALIEAIEAGKVRPAPAGHAAPQWLRTAVLRGLRGRAADRWPTITALLDHLHARLRRPRRVAIIAGGVLAIASVITAVAIATRRGPAITPARDPQSSFATSGATTSGDVMEGALSPDGRQVAVVTEHDLLLVDLDGTGARRVLSSDLASDSDGSLSWSPDGKRLSLLTQGPHDRQHLIIDVDSGAKVHARPARGLVAFVGDDELATWTSIDRSFAIESVTDPTQVRTCNVPGSFHFLRTIVSAGGEIFIGVTSGTGGIGGVDRVIRTDRTCSSFQVLAEHLELRELARSQDGTKVIGLVAGAGAHGEIMEIDRDGRVSRRPAPPFDRDVGRLLGMRPDGSIVMLDGKTSWQLLRLDQDAAVVLTRGSTRARIVMAPDAARFAIIEGDRSLRIVEVANPMGRAAPIKDAVDAVAWSPDGRELAILRRAGGKLVLTTEVVGGGASTEHVVEEVSYSFYPSLAWIDPDVVAFRRAGNRTYTAIDVRTGATRDLFDPAVGFTFAVERSPRDGTLALYWNRKDPGPGLYLVPPDQPPKLLLPGHLFPAWAPDATALYAFWGTSPEIARFDLATGRSAPYATVPLERGATIVDVWALPSGELLVQRGVTTSDVIVATPAP